MYNRSYLFQSLNRVDSAATWLHIGIVYNATEDTVVAYLNARSDKWKQPTISGRTSSNEPDHWQIGRYFSSSQQYSPTKIDELIFWDRSLNSDEIKAIYEGSNRSGKFHFPVTTDSIIFRIKILRWYVCAQLATIGNRGQLNTDL